MNMDIKRFLDIEKGYITLREASQKAGGRNAEFLLGGSKIARYYASENCLQIFVDHEMVYENNNGIICDDLVALADGFCEY